MGQESRIKIALGQMKINQGEGKENLKKMLGMVEAAAAQGADILCFPELSYTGYALTVDKLYHLAEPLDGSLIKTFRAWAKTHGIHIIAGYAELGDIPGQMYNSCIFIDDTGNVIGNMRKVNLWKSEKSKFRGGDSFPVFETKFGKIGLLICYDMEFPEPSRILALKGAKIVFCPALWSKTAARRWKIDLAGNALFNLMFVAGANTVDDVCCGSSKIVGPEGEVRAEASKIEEELLFCDIDLDEIVEVRSRIPYFNDFKEDTFSMNAVNI